MILQKDKEMKSMSEIIWYEILCSTDRERTKGNIHRNKKKKFIDMHTGTHLLDIFEWCVSVYTVQKSPDSRRHSAFPFYEMFTYPGNRIFSES